MSSCGLWKKERRQLESETPRCESLSLLRSQWDKHAIALAEAEPPEPLFQRGSGLSNQLNTEICFSSRDLKRNLDALQKQAEGNLERSRVRRQLETEVLHLSLLMPSTSACSSYTISVLEGSEDATLPRASETGENELLTGTWVAIDALWMPELASCMPEPPSDKKVWLLEAEAPTEVEITTDVLLGFHDTRRRPSRALVTLVSSASLPGQATVASPTDSLPASNDSGPTALYASELVDLMIFKRGQSGLSCRREAACHKLSSPGTTTAGDTAALRSLDLPSS